MIYARLQYQDHIDKTLVMELYEPPSGFSLNDCFHPDVAAQFMDISDLAERPELNWEYKDGIFVPPVILPDPEPKLSYDDLLKKVLELETRLSAVEK